MIRLFDSHTSIDICLKNSNPYVALAAEDLRNDFARVNASGIKQTPEDLLRQLTNSTGVIKAEVLAG